MDKHIINDHCTLIEALDQLNRLSGQVMTLFAVNQRGEMTGTLTDGDVRRALLAGLTLQSLVSEAMHRSFLALDHKELSAETMKEAQRRGVRLLPRLDSDKRIVGLVDLNRTRALLPLTAILMAGGKGERLRPMTLTRPKPLLEIDGKAIIDYNVELLAAVGIDDITVTTRYLADQIKEHFSRPVAGVNVKCVEETEPLGTIGAAQLVEERNPEGATLIMNSDLLTTIRLEEMWERHKETKAAITIAAIPYVVSVPYAILGVDDMGAVGSIEEKPTYSHYANAGIYIINNDVLERIPRNERYDATDLVEQAIADGERVTYYPISGTWIDIGSPTDFRQAQELMKHHRDLPTNN